MTVSWDDDPLTEQEVERLGRGARRATIACTAAALMLVLAMIAVGLSAAAEPQHEPGPPYGIGTALIVENATYQGKNIRWWARRAVQARKDANKRGQTILRLRGTLERGFIPSYWLAIGSCESGLRWTYDGSSGFDGAVQFHPGTWSSYRLPSYPAFAYQATPFQQLVVAELVLARQGWGAWPSCSRKLGLR